VDGDPLITKSDIFRISREKGLPAGIIEKEYILSIFLERIAKSDSNLIFKGGTALSKFYLDYYRLSEDLDFTYTGNEIKNAIEAIHTISASLGYKIKDENETEGSYTAKIKYLGPLQYPNFIKIDISLREKLIFEPRAMTARSFYADVEPFTIKVYDLREITAEKVRTLIQRKKPRDYFDLWYILKNKNYDLIEIKIAVIEKCRRIGIEYEPHKIFSDIGSLRKQWKTDLIHLVTELPDFDMVITDLRNKLECL